MSVTVNMVISHELEFVYLGIPRTANRATHFALLQLPGAIQHSHLHEMEIPDQCKSYFTFCCVRNPYQRFLSWYRWRSIPHPWGQTVKDWTFAEYVERVGNRELGPMTVRGFTQNNRLDHVYRFEDLPLSLQSIDRIRGIESVKLEVCGQKLSRHWQQFFDQRLADRVYRICQADFEEFGYDRDSWRMEGYA